MMEETAMNMTKSRFSVVIVAAGLLTAFASQAWSAGSEDDDTAPPPKTQTTTKCKDGKVWDSKKKECVDPKKSSLNDDQIFQAAREFAYAGQYQNAINVLHLAKNQDDPRILNYLGYSNRKAGRMQLGMSYYHKALQQDENYILARSYMGQALLLQGDVQAARVQLVEIRDRGGENTWAYRSLLQSLNGYRQY
jgi:tetratricopeptide (TPR) repeat protein